VNTTIAAGSRPAPRRAARAARVAGGLLGLAVAFTAVMGFAHTKPGRPLLALMGMASGGKAKGGGCPFGYDVPPNPEQREAGLRKLAAAHPSDTVAPARPGLGFELGRDTRADVDRWAASFGITCKKPRSGIDLECTDVPDAAVPSALRGARVSSLWFNFDASSAISGLVVNRHADDAALAQSTYASVTADITEKAGPTATVHGEPTVAFLSQGQLAQVSAEYYFQNYSAVIRATSLRGGFSVTETYRRLAN
jgi:hypothetical protein